MASFAEEGSPFNKVAGLGFGSGPGAAALDELETWLDVVVDADLHPDTQGVPSHEEFTRETLARAEHDLVTATGVRRYAALRGGSSPAAPASA